MKALTVFAGIKFVCVKTMLVMLNNDVKHLNVFSIVKIWLCTRQRLFILNSTVNRFSFTNI